MIMLDESFFARPEPGADLVRLDDALGALAQFDPRKAKAWLLCEMSEGARKDES